MAPKKTGRSRVFGSSYAAARNEEQVPIGRERIAAEAKSTAFTNAIRRKRGGTMPTYQELGNQPYPGWE